MTRDNILLRKRAVSKRVELPSDRAFFAKYKRVSRKIYRKMLPLKGKRNVIRSRN